MLPILKCYPSLNVPIHLFSVPACPMRDRLGSDPIPKTMDTSLNVP